MTNSGSKDVIIYQLHVKAFQDSNDDRVGDFVGLTERLDYLRDLGGYRALAVYPSTRAPAATTATTSPIPAKLTRYSALCGIFAASCGTPSAEACGDH